MRRQNLLTTHDIDVCDICGKELKNKESIDRHRGTTCHMNWMEKRLHELEEQMQMARAAIAILLKGRC